MKKLKYGDLIAFAPSTKTGNLIRLIDSKGEGKYSHWAIVLGDYKGFTIFIESMQGIGVRLNVLQEWRTNYDVFRPSIRPRPINEMLDMVGFGYDYNRIWRLLKNRIFGTPLYGDSPSEPICTELCNYAYNYRLVKSGTATPWTLEQLEWDDFKKIISYVD